MRACFQQVANADIVACAESASLGACTCPENTWLDSKAKTCVACVNGVSSAGVCLQCWKCNRNMKMSITSKVCFLCIEIEHMHHVDFMSKYWGQGFSFHDPDFGISHHVHKHGTQDPPPAVHAHARPTSTRHPTHQATAQPAPPHLLQQQVRSMYDESREE